MSEELPLILHPQTGTAFKSEKTAGEVMRKKSYSHETHLVIPHHGGFAILDTTRLSADFFHLHGGVSPYGSLEEAQEARIAREVSEERARPVRYKGGWALLSMDAVANPQGLIETPVPKKRPKLTYSLVEFDERYPGSPEPELVVLSLVNLDITLQMQRGVPVVVPDPVLEIADNATYQRYTHREHEGRKIGAKIRRTGYKRIRAATEEEFRLMVKEGARALEEYLKTTPAQAEAILETSV